MKLSRSFSGMGLMYSSQASIWFYQRKRGGIVVSVSVFLSIHMFDPIFVPEPSDGPVLLIVYVSYLGRCGKHRPARRTSEARTDEA